MLNFLGRRTMKGEKATAKTSLMAHMTIPGAVKVFLRFSQFIMGIVVIGLYAQDLDKARKAGKYADSKWVYAVFCGSWSAILALVFMLPYAKAWFYFAFDTLTFLFWLILFGIFGKMYIPENPEGDSGIIRMKRAAWIDLTNMILWAITMIWGGIVWWRVRTGKTIHTGRAPSQV